MNSREDYSINTRLNLKIRYLEEKKKHTIISEMSPSIFVPCSSKCKLGFCATDNFRGTFIDFRFMIIFQERISTYVDSRP